ncbi:hypothetical protein ANN_09158 [Periplaneta americana]|uniref:Transposase n=1 Tax=Periplaneta americana TaxID=6978 RepID=A0ABQ8TMB9_PERAM|nr:hypothetical protein ANN_09158 [Periplaneta americana]
MERTRDSNHEDYWKNATVHQFFTPSLLMSSITQDDGDNAGEMSPGSNTESYPALAHIGLRKNPGKNLKQHVLSNDQTSPYSGKHQPLAADDDDLFSRLIFSDEATFHTSGKINKHNCRVWGTQEPHRIIEHERDSPKVNVFCALSQRKLYGPFFVIEATVTGHSYLDMSEQWLVPQLRQDLDDDFIFQQDGAPPHFHNAVRAYLNTEMSDRWIGRAGRIFEKGGKSIDFKRFMSLRKKI